MTKGRLDHKCLDTESWAVLELGQTDLGDPRRTKRLLQLTVALATNPACSLPEACKSWADTKAAYRFLDNDDVEPEAILHGHRQSTLQRIGGSPLVLAIQDTTTFNFSSHPATQGLGPVGGKRPGQKSPPTGFLVHSCLAVTPEGVPLGLLGKKLWVRPRANEVQDQSGSVSDAKESVRWAEMLRISTQGIPAGVTVLTVADREADIYDFFVEVLRLGQEALVRSKYQRTLAGGVYRLWDVVERTEVVEKLVIEVPRGDDRPSRTATLELRIARVCIQKPPSARTTDDTGLTLSAVLAREVNCPEGQEPIEWRLLTTLLVVSAEDARNCVHWYAKRWTIERYHYTLKSGCKIEELQLETVDRLHRALAVYSVVAWRLLYLTYMARVEPDRPCTEFLSDSEWQVLYCHFHRTKRLPQSPPDLRTVVVWIGRLGGFLARKRDGNPGVKVLWTGYRRLQDMVVMWDLLRSDD